MARKALRVLLPVSVATTVFEPAVLSVALMLSSTYQMSTAYEDRAALADINRDFYRFHAPREIRVSIDFEGRAALTRYSGREIAIATPAAYVALTIASWMPWRAARNAAASARRGSRRPRRPGRR